MKRVTIRGILAAFLIGAAAMAIAAPTPQKEAPLNPDDACLACYGDATAKNRAGKSIAVDAAKFGGSVHGSMQLPCTGCHTDVSADKFPHDKVKPVECTTCHEKAVKEYTISIHGKARAEGRKVAAKCADCYGAHDMRPKTDPENRVARAKIPGTCGSCQMTASQVRIAAQAAPVAAKAACMRARRPRPHRAWRCSATMSAEQTSCSLSSRYS